MPTWSRSTSVVTAERSAKMNYQLHYDRLMERARIRGTSLMGYVEKHHVLPSCLGGGDEVENIVRLTAEEHYVAHQLLVKMYPGNAKLLWAIISMSGGNQHQNRSCKIYGWLRRRLSAERSISSKGRKFSDEARANMSASQQARGPRPPHSEETKAKMSAASKGRPKSDAHRAALAAAKLGKKRAPHSEETKAKMRVSQQALAKKRQGVPREPSATRSESVKLSWAARRKAHEALDSLDNL